MIGFFQVQRSRFRVLLVVKIWVGQENVKSQIVWDFVTCETHGFDKKETWNLSFAAQFFAILLVHDLVCDVFLYTDNLIDFNSYKWKYLVLDVERTSSIYHILSPGKC